MLLGGPAPAPAVWAGMALVAAGLASGLRRTTAGRPALLAAGRTRRQPLRRAAAPVDQSAHATSTG